ncbi:MAG: HlyD family efflux transporter periplasmic adaptor subunit [Bacteroidales bacterium]|nr:HlyD family efflux transporter periplasmic adaptor subunit [Bacteroidales bacterium]
MKDTVNKDTDRIEIRSEEVRELLGQVPRWILRWGITIIALTIVILIAGSALFRYPDTRSAEIILTTENPPANLVAKINGKIQKLFVKDDQLVAKGQILALIETAASYEDIMKAGELLRDWQTDADKAAEIYFGTGYELGEIQSFFASFVKDYHDYRHFIMLNYHRKKIQSVQNELKKYDEYYQRLEEQSVVQGKELDLARRQFRRDSSLYRQGVIASSDYEKSESNMLKIEFSFKETETSLANARIQVSKLNQQILDLELEYNKELKQKENLVNESYDKLMAEIDLWKQKYLIISPLNGRVSFTRFWSENQQVTEGETVVTIVPENPGQILGKINLSVEGAGKVREGQQVNIKFANYPYMEFGMVKGVVTSISQVPNQNYYTVEVRLTNDLVTNYGTEIEFRQEMPGRAEIITENLSLLKRIINPVKSVIKRQEMNR